MFKHINAANEVGGQGRSVFRKGWVICKVSEIFFPQLKQLVVKSAFTCAVVGNRFCAYVASNL